MTGPEVRAFLTEGTRTGKLAYTSVDGRPLAVPVWFVMEGDTLVVDLEEPPFGFVQVQGEALVSEEPGELIRTATEIARRYMGAERAEEFGRRNGVPDELVVRPRPTKVIAAMDMTA